VLLSRARNVKQQIPSRSIRGVCQS